MSLRYIVIHGFLHIRYFVNKITGGGPFGPHGAIYLENRVPEKSNPLKAALFKYHVKQYHGSSCSVASVVTVINALRDLQQGETHPITQLEILEKVRTGFWKERMSPGGHRGRRGLPLPLLGEIVESSLNAYGLQYKAVETISGTKDPAQKQDLKERLRNCLVDFETRGDCVIIAHFDQGAFVRTLSIPHISPVGAFDLRNDEVTVLDVDPEQVRFYKVPLDTFCAGLFDNYPIIMRPFGYRTGGYVCITLK